MSPATRGRGLAVLVFVLLVGAGCTLLRPSAGTDPDRGKIPGQKLRQAEALLAEGDLERAAVELRHLVEAHPGSPEAPRALFQLAVVHLAPDSPRYDSSRGLALLRDLVERHPSSPWRVASQAVLDLAATNADLHRLTGELRSQLEQLKQIDLGPDG